MQNKNQNRNLNSYQDMKRSYDQWNSIDTDGGIIIAAIFLGVVGMACLAIMGPFALILFAIIGFVIAMAYA